MLEPLEEYLVVTYCEMIALDKGDPYEFKGKWSKVINAENGEDASNKMRCWLMDKSVKYRSHLEKCEIIKVEKIMSDWLEPGVELEFVEKRELPKLPFEFAVIKDMIGLSARDLLMGTWTPMVREPIMSEVEKGDINDTIKAFGEIVDDFEVLIVKREIAELYGKIYESGYFK
jgi:hypothetical protein